MLYTRSTIQGVLARDYYSRYPEMLREMSQWIRDKKIKYHETIIEGFEKLPSSLNAMFHGQNTGKLVVKI